MHRNLILLIILAGGLLAVILSGADTPKEAAPKETFDHARAEYFRNGILRQSLQLQLDHFLIPNLFATCSAEGGTLTGMDRSDPVCTAK